MCSSYCPTGPPPHYKPQPPQAGCAGEGGGGRREGRLLSADSRSSFTAAIGVHDHAGGG